jgi:putative flavoprotein involved in K+ transport
MDLRSGEIRAIVWATGFRPDYSWLDVPVVDAKGHLSHEGGVVSSPGMYALGLPVLRRRKSSFIYGVGDDARDVIDHLAGYLAGHPPERPIHAEGRNRADAQAGTPGPS